MTDKAISPLRRRLIEDMTIRRLGPATQHQYKGDGPCLPSSNPPSSVMLAGQLLGINPQTLAQVALAPSSRPKPPPMPVAPCMSGGRGRIPDRESQGSQRTRWWREVDSNPRSRAKRTTARHCFLVPFVTTPVLPKGLTLPRPGDHSGRYAKEAERRKCCRAGAVLVWNNRETEMANLVEIKALFLALVGGSPGAEGVFLNQNLAIRSTSVF